MVFKISAADDRADVILQRLWELEELKDKSVRHTTDVMHALDHFQGHTQRNPDGRYAVSLPKSTPTPSLEESRKTALRRYKTNKRSLEKRGAWQPFDTAVREYAEMGHAERVPEEEMKRPCGDTYYLPMH